MSDNIDYKKTGVISEIERYAINDGPGIRTNVFLKGCPLACQWCANPETQKSGKQLMYWITRCIGCKRCIKLCPNQALAWDEGRLNIDRKRCQACGACVRACHSEALTIVGEIMTVREVMEIVRKDQLFYQNSGGGLTFSGGEAMEQIDFLCEMAKAAHAEGINTCIETSGYAPANSFLQAMPDIDLFLFDLKMIDNNMHKKYTGVSNEWILNNFSTLVKAGAQVQARIPIISGINDTDKNIFETIKFLKKTDGHSHVSLLPYHRLGESKYEKLGIPYVLKDIQPPSGERMREIASCFEINGFEVTIGE